jgi:Carboxypeptidase regulatory-like domain/TonB dependent receptor-like, beta-barrel/TonB-dependent Receptor Plug Domain
MIGNWHCFRYLRLVALALLLPISLPVHGQGTAGAISGTVTDQSGRVVPGAEVTVTNRATHIARVLTTNDSGFFSIEALYTGSYAVRVAKEGFKEKTTLDVQIAPGERRALNMSIEVGSATSQVTVSADPATINTETAESGGTVTAKEIDNLMLNGRDFQTLATMIPGVASVNAADNLSGVGITGKNTTLIVNGQGTETTTYTIDGVYDMNSGSLSALNIVPMVDGIAQFSVLKDNYSAKYGLAGSGQIVVSTKSGTDTFRGSAWEYIRNTAFNAVNYFATSQQVLHQNIYGFTIGGPIMIPKLYNTDRSKRTFFFAAVQWNALNTPLVTPAAVFPQAMRDGDFSASPTLRGQLALDAHSQALLAAEGKTNCITGPSTLNPSCFDPTAVALMNAVWPLPNNPSAGFYNFLSEGSAVSRERDEQFRIDHAINASNVLTARMMHQPSTLYNPAYSTLFAPVVFGEPYASWNNLVRDTTIFTPKLINTISVGSTEDRFKVTLDGDYTLPAGANIIQAFPGADPLNRIPTVSLSGGWAGTGVSVFPATFSDGEGLAFDDVTWVKGNHVLQAGALYMFGIKRQTVFTSPQGVFSFSGAHTGDPAADYLLGLDTTYSQANAQKHGNFHYRQGEAYLQDDWKTTRRLTLNLGLRYVYFSNDTVSGNQVTSFSTAANNAADAPVVNVNGTLQVNSANQPVNAVGQPASLVNGLLFAGQNGVPSGFFTPVKTNFAPRIGFAYDLRGNGKSSLRGGYGIGYSRTPVEQIFNAFGQNPPYVQSANVLNSLLSNALAGTAPIPTTQTLSNVPLNFKPTQVQTYSLTLEQQVGRNTIATLAYAGSQGRHLMTYQGGYDQNFPLPVAAPSVSGCLPAGQGASSAYDLDPCINSAMASPDFTRPYQGYTTMNSVYDEGTSNYNSLQSNLIYTAGASRFTVAYTFSKALATLGAHDATDATFTGVVIQNPRNPKAEYGPPAYDFTNDLTGTWVYAIPYFAHGNRFVSLGLGNWSFAGLALHQSGFALSPGLATSTAGEAIRPDQVGPYRRVGKLNEWFDTTSFAAPGFGFFGNAGNGTIRGPAYTSFNTSLYKTFPITERFNAQFRVEAFNVANHPNFNNVSTAFGTGNFGQVTSAGDPRELEFALKLTY